MKKLVILLMVLLPLACEKELVVTEALGENGGIIGILPGILDFRQGEHGLVSKQEEGSLR